MQSRPYYGMMDQICRSNGWILGSDKGEMVVAIPQQDGTQQSVVINDFADQATGQAAIRIWSPVAPADRVPVDQAMTVNFQLPAGAFAVHEGVAVICTTRVVNSTDQAELTPLLQTIAQFAKFYHDHYA